MKQTRRFAAFLTRLCASLTLTGCAPVYEVRDEFIPPISPPALQCTHDCQQIEAACHEGCDRTYARCAAAADSQARRDLPAAVEVYAAQLKAYQAQSKIYDREYRHFREDKRKLDRSYDAAKRGCAKGDRAACAEKKRLKKAKSDLWADYHGPDGPLSEKPEQPAQPTLAKETARIRSETCSNDCGCMERFKVCYIGCGGRIESRRYCLEHCE